MSRITIAAIVLNRGPDAEKVRKLKKQVRELKAERKRLLEAMPPPPVFEPEVEAEPEPEYVDPFVTEPEPEPVEPERHSTQRIKLPEGFTAAPVRPEPPTVPVTPIPSSIFDLKRGEGKKAPKTPRARTTRRKTDEITEPQDAS